MYQIGALLALFSNFYNEKYRDIVCTGVENLVMEFSMLDWTCLSTERRKLYIRNDGLCIPVKDEIREDLLNEFIEYTLELSSTEDNFLDKWLNKIDRYIESWNVDFVDVDSHLVLQ